MAKSKIEFNRNKIIQENHKKEAVVIHMLKSEVAKDTEKYIPFKHGGLRRSVDASVRNSDKYLVYDKIYAAFQWFGKVMIGISSHKAWANRYERKKSTNKPLTYGQPGTGGQWITVSKKVNLRKWVLFAKKAWKKDGK